MPNGKLPAYFKEYFDEKFNGVLKEIENVKCDVADLKAQTEKKTNKLMYGVLFVAGALVTHLGSEGGWFQQLLAVLF